MSAVHPAFKARRFSPVRVVAGTLRVVTALLLLGILVLLVALVGQGSAGAREPDQATTADPRGTGTVAVPRDPTAADAVNVAEGQAHTLLAQLERATDLEGQVLDRPLPVPPAPRGPNDTEGRISTVPPVAQMTLPERLRPEQGSVERGGGGGGGGEDGSQDLRARVAVAGVAVGAAPTLVAQYNPGPPGEILPGPGRGQVPARLIGDPEPIDYGKAAEGKPVVLVIQNWNISKAESRTGASDKYTFAAALPQLKQLGFQALTMDNLLTTVDPNSRRAVGGGLLTPSGLFAPPNFAPGWEKPRADYLYLYDQARKIGLRVRGADSPWVDEDRDKYTSGHDKSARTQAELISSELAAGGRVLAATHFSGVGYPKNLWPGDNRVNIVLAEEKGIPSVVWEFLPEGQGRGFVSDTDRALDQLLQEHKGKGGFMVKVYGDPSREIDWLIVPGPGARRGGGGGPDQDDGAPGPRYGETPPTAPPREEHAVLPAPPEQPLELLATREAEGQPVAVQAVVGAPAGDDHVTTVSDRLDSGSAGLPSAAFGNDFTGQPSTAASGDPAPAVAAMAGVFDNHPEVSPTTEVSADPPAQTVVADAGGDTGGDLFPSNDMSFGFGDVAT